jgi:hypothetical protein
VSDGPATARNKVLQRCGSVLNSRILEDALEAYDVPFTGDAAVWADVTAPDASSMLVKLDGQSDGRFAGSFVATLTGVYLCRVRAEGYFRSKACSPARRP